MGERRKRRSMWDMEEENKHFTDMSKHNSSMGKEYHSNHDEGHYRQFSQKYRDHSGKQSWEENSVDPMNGGFRRSRQNGPERKELGGGNRYYQEMSPGLDGMEPHKYNHPLENDRGRAISQRNMGRARSRSRSRSMRRGRSRSRSLSRGRGRERERGRGRSRSRSRSPIDSAVRIQTRSRSPIGDYRHQSHVWNERSAPDKSTPICRDFASGGCRRGSQCRFFHPKSISGDGDHIPNHSYRDDVSDPYHGPNEQFHNKSRNAVPCKDFIKGNCRWGDTCRFSHHFASDETFGRGNRNKSFDNDIEFKACTNGKPLCKYFAAGNCDRDNCRFSHDDPKLNSQESRRGEVTDNHSLNDRGSNRRTSGNSKPDDRSESMVGVKNDSSDTAAARNDSRWGNSFEKENTSYVREVGTSEAIYNENMVNKQEELILRGLQLQNQDGNSNTLGQDRLLEDQSFSMTAWQQNVFPVSHIQQQSHGPVENNLVSSLRPEVPDDAKDSRNTTNPVFFSGQNLSQNSENVFPGHSSVLSETDGAKNMLFTNPLNGFGSDLSRPETHLAVRLSLQSQMENIQKAVQMTGMLETKVPQNFPTLKESPFSDEQENHTEHENHVQLSFAGGEPDNSKVEPSGSPKPKQEKVLENSEPNEGNKGNGDESKGFQNNKHSETVDGLGKVEESITTKDDKGIRVFKNSLVEFVKDLLKPTWKEGRMSREVHKTIVKKVVDKVTSTLQADQIPKTQEKVEQYLSYSKPKIAKLVQAYVGRCSKKDS